MTHGDSRKQLSSPVLPSDRDGPLSSPLGESNQSDRSSGESLVWTSPSWEAPAVRPSPGREKHPGDQTPFTALLSARSFVFPAFLQSVH